MVRNLPTVTEITAAVRASRTRELQHLRWCLVRDTLILLNIETGQYHALGGEDAHRFVEFSKGADDPELLASLTEAGLTAKGEGLTEGSVPLNIPGGFPMAVKSLLVARRNLKRMGFQAVLSWAIAHRPQRFRPNAIESFKRAEMIFPSRLGDFDCLPRALGLFAFLRHSTLRPELVMGFKQHPFFAHAWVEIDGVPVLESDTGKNRVTLFREILRV